MKSAATIACVSMALVLSACGDQEGGPQASARKPEAPKARALTQEERDAIVANATKGLNLQRDKMERISFYRPPRQEVMPLLKDRLSTYVSLPDGRMPILRVYIFYYGNDWVFLERMKVVSDDEVVYERAFEHSLVKREIRGVNACETVDYAATDNELVSIRKIASAKKTTMRFYGNSDSRQEDHDVSSGETESLKMTLKAYDELSAALK